MSLLEHSCIKRSDKRQKEGKMDEIKLFGLYGGGISGACTCSTNNTQLTWKAPHRACVHIVLGIAAMRALFSCTSEVKSLSLGFPTLLLACLSYHILLVSGIWTNKWHQICTFTVIAGLQYASVVVKTSPWPKIFLI